MRHSADQPYIPRAGTLPAQVVNFFMAAPDERLRTRGPACPPRKDQGTSLAAGALDLIYRIRVAAGDPEGKLMQDELVDRIAGMRATHEATKKGWK